MGWLPVSYTCSDTCGGAHDALAAELRVNSTQNAHRDFRPEVNPSNRLRPFATTHKKLIAVDIFLHHSWLQIYARFFGIRSCSSCNDLDNFPPCGRTIDARMRTGDRTWSGGRAVVSRPCHQDRTIPLGIG